MPPQELWDDAGELTCYSTNRTLKVRDTGKCPYELAKNKLWVGQLYPFGCEAMYVNPDRDKFESRSSRGIIVNWLALSRVLLFLFPRGRVCVRVRERAWGGGGAATPLPGPGQGAPHAR